jgi:phosphonate transport system substrate-binding protein
VLSPITLAVIPSTTPGDRRVALDALCATLAPMLGRPVQGALPESYSALTEMMVMDRVQFAWMPPVLMVLTDEHVKIRPLLCAVRNDRIAYSSVLFVDADGPFLHTHELHGKTVAWVDSSSASGYLYPRLHLAAAGIDPTRLFGSELFVGSHAEVVRAVFDGRADVGATYAEIPRDGEPVRHAGFVDVAPERRARILESTRAIPNDLIVAHPNIPTDEYRAFARAILRLGTNDDGRRLLHHAFHAEKFNSNLRGTLGSLWNLVELARSHGLLNQL